MIDPCAILPLEHCSIRYGMAMLPPTAADLRQAIEGPAALADVGLTFDADLVGDLLFDLHEQAGALPLLQFTLDQLFLRRTGRRLTAEAYRALGGVRGALWRGMPRRPTPLCLARSIGPGPCVILAPARSGRHGAGRHAPPCRPDGVHAA